MFDLRKIISVIMVLLFGIYPLSFSQQHENKPGFGVFDNYIPNVIYTIRAEIIPDSLLVRGMIEIEFKNHYGDSLKEIQLQLNRSGSLDSQIIYSESSYIFFDSILYYGAPVKKDRIEFDNTSMFIKLPSALIPNHKGFFLISFTTRIYEENIVRADNFFWKLSGWYPRLVYEMNNEYSQNDNFKMSGRQEYARHYIGLKIDSSYNLVFSGRLNNEKEHCGFMSKQKPGEVRVDIESYGKDIYGNKFMPVFEDGFKYYYINQPTAESFSVAIRKKQIHDRVVTEDVTIDVFYTNDDKVLWERTIANLVFEIITKYKPELGKFKYPYIAVCASSFDDEYFSNDPVIFIPESIKDPEILYSYLTSRIFSLWFATPSKDSGSDEIVARSLYKVSKILYEDFNDKDYKIFLKLLKWLGVIDYDNNVINYSLRDKLAWLYLWSYENKNFNGYNNIESGDLDISSFINSNDIGIDSVAQSKNGAEYKITCYVNDSCCFFPIEMGVVTINGDTLIERYYNDDYNKKSAGGNISVVFTKTVRQKPMAVILDPNYHLPDINRSNNFYYLRKMKFRPHSEKAIFPGFYK